MITKISHARKFGILDNFNWNNQLDDFSRRNIIYAYNGGGKTTLSSVFRLYSLLEVKEIKDELFSEVSTHQDASIQVEADNKIMEYHSERGIDKIYVFNCDFITDHIYEGTISKMRRFDAKVKSNLKDKEINELEKHIAEKQNQLDKANDDILKANERFESIKKRVSAAFGKKVSNKRLTGVEIQDLPVLPKTIAELESEIESKVKSYNISLQMDQLRADVETLKALTLENVEVDHVKVVDLLAKNLASSARGKLEEKILSFKKSSNQQISDGIEIWYKKAQLLLQHTAEQTKINCPVCDTDISSFSEDLFAEFQSFFNDEYDLLIRQLDSSISYLPQLVGRVAANNDKVNELNQLLLKYLGDGYTAVEFAVLVLTNLFQSLQSLYERKRSDININLANEFDAGNLKSILDEYNAFLDSCIKTRDKLVKSLEKQKLDPKKLETEIKECYKQLALVEFDADNTTTGQIAKYRTLTTRVTVLTSEIGKLNIVLGKAIAKLKNEAKHVNRFLKELGIHHFTIDVHETKPSENIEILYESAQESRD